MAHNESSPEREVHSDTGLLEKVSNKQPNPTLQELEEQQQTKLRASRRKEISRSEQN